MKTIKKKVKRWPSTIKLPRISLCISGPTSPFIQNDVIGLKDQSPTKSTAKHKDKNVAREEAVPSSQDATSIIIEDGEGEHSDDSKDTQMATIARFEHRLPFELWSQVFAHAADTDHGYGSEMYFDMDQPLWLCGVCRFWRSVAAGTPGLWTHLNVTSPRVKSVRAFIERSGTLPIYVVYKSSSEEDKENDKLHMELLTSCVSRIRVLHIYAARQAWLWGQLASLSAPTLETISLWRVSYRSGGDAEGESVPLAFFQSPALRRIYLDEMRVLLTSPIFSQQGVTHLTLNKTSFPDWSSLQLYDTLVSLGDSLMELHISFDKSWHQFFEPLPQRLALPKLEVLRLNCKPEATLYLLNSLSTPAFIQIDSEDWYIRDLKEIVPSDMSRLTAVHRTNHLEFSLWADLAVHVEGYCTPSAVSGSQSAGDALDAHPKGQEVEKGDLLFDLTAYPSTAASDAFDLDNLWRIFNPQQVTHMTLTTDMPDARFAEKWPAMLAAAPELRSLSFRGDSIAGLVAALSHGRPPAALRMLSVHLFPLVQESTKLTRWDETSLTGLMEYLQMRKTMHIPLAALIINCPNQVLDNSGLRETLWAWVDRVQVDELEDL